jgi:hypothetical protein
MNKKQPRESNATQANEMKNFMKSLIAVLTASAVLSLGAQQAKADCAWATAGKVLTGMAIGGAIASAFAPAPHVVYTAPPVAYAPAPVYGYTPAPVAAPAPVYNQSAPAVVYTAPAVVYAPYPYYYYGACRPVVSVRFGCGGGHYYHHGH